VREVKVPKIKLVEEKKEVDLDRKQSEIDNYYKFKRKQDKIKRRKEKMEK